MYNLLPANTAVVSILNSVIKRFFNFANNYSLLEFLGLLSLLIYELMMWSWMEMAACITLFLVVDWSISAVFLLIDLMGMLGIPSIVFFGLSRHLNDQADLFYLCRLLSISLAIIFIVTSCFLINELKKKSWKRWIGAFNFEEHNGRGRGHRVKPGSFLFLTSFANLKD